jgi:L-alanine-DL-glutamate epimerase-like enolase superfamily enzyme
MLKMHLTPVDWPLIEPFAISRGVETHARTLVVTLTDSNNHAGRGESSGVTYHGETIASLMHDLEAVRIQIEAGIDRQQLGQLLPAGGARAGLDAALWDLEAKQSGTPAWRLAGLPAIHQVDTAFTIGIRDAAGYAHAAAQRADFRYLKVKVSNHDPLVAIAAVHRAAPAARLIVDPNQSWNVEMVEALAPALAEMGVVLLEQPFLAGSEDGLAGYRCPIEIAADEAVQHRGDLARAARFYDVVNIKLDKSGGLTEALALADEAEALGMGLMVGCMLGSSLSIAPAMLLAQRCRFVDLDCPLLQAEDCDQGLAYSGGTISPPEPALWG